MKSRPTFNRRPTRRIDPLQVRIMMLRKGIKAKKLMKKFKVTKPAISLALAGKRRTLLGKIYDYVTTA